MTPRPRPSRRTFIGLGAAAAAGVGAVAAARELGGQAEPARTAASKLVARRRPATQENDLLGDPHWPIRHLGAPDAMLGDRKSVG